MLSYTSVVASSVAVSSSSVGDSSELVVLWESVAGLALFRFLLLVGLEVLLVGPVVALQGGEGGVAAPVSSVACEGGVAGRGPFSMRRLYEAMPDVSIFLDASSTVSSDFRFHDKDCLQHFTLDTAAADDLIYY